MGSWNKRLYEPSVTMYMAALKKIKCCLSDQSNLDGASLCDLHVCMLCAVTAHNTT